MKNKRYGIREIVFPSVEKSIFFSKILLLFLLILSFYMFFLNTSIEVNADMLEKLSEFSMTVILSIVALGISVFQSDTQLFGENVEVKKELFIRYVFDKFFCILWVLLGYLVAIAFPDNTDLIRILCFLVTVLIIWKILNTITCFYELLKRNN